MSMDWQECNSKMIVKKTKPDKGMIKSLMKSSENKMESEGMLAMNDVTAASKLSLAYDSMRELLEALAMKEGYKVYNHECYTAFLKEIIGASLKGDEFDAIRKARNAVNYYGKGITRKDAEKHIKKMIVIRNFLLNLLKV